MKTTTLRPGILVSLKTSLTGNVQYQRDDLESEHLTEDGRKKARWQTTRVVQFPAEFEAGRKARSKARSIITSICALSSFGLLCPRSDMEKLEQAITDARTLVADFNDKATLSRLSIYVICGQIAENDVEAARAISSEIADLILEMKSGVENLDAKAIRDAASRARSIGQMLTPDAAIRLQFGIDAARSTARAIVKAGEQAAQEIDRGTIRKLEEARTAFLDLDEPLPVVAPVRAASRAVDLLSGPSLDGGVA